MITNNENHSHLHKINDLDIETLWVQPVGVSSDETLNRPLVVFLHEGLGSVALWRDFPQALCNAVGLRGLMFSRVGYGQSTPRQAHEHWSADFLHEQAIRFLPAYLASLGVDTKTNPPILFGHSDGASIALIYAATYPAQARAVIALAPHSFVEDICITAIEQARITYATDLEHPKNLRSKLSKYHADVDSAFYGWCDVWLSQEFHNFDIRPLLPNITCPVLAIQGEQDAYGTMAQIEYFAQQLKLAPCGHSPHIDQPTAVVQRVQEMMGLMGLLKTQS